MRRIIVVLLVVLVSAGCAVNPVTGQRELSLVGEQWELDVGRENYAPLRQMQGGDFTLEPELVSYVQDVGHRLAAVSDRELPYEFSVINDSTPNAWALPGGKISINRGLLTEMQSEAELAAVLGHEIVHSAARHGAQSQSRAVLMQGAVMAGGVAAGVATDDQRYAQIAVMGGMLGAQLVSQRYSREAEREADEFGMRYMHRAGYNPRGAVELQQTFVRLSEGRRAGAFDALFASHPPSQERVENNRRLLAELGDEGEIGRERYQRMTAGLRQMQPAFEAYDEGRKALAEGDTATALAKAELALAVDSREARFHSLRGDALAERGEFGRAEQAYAQALEHDPSWFYHHLRLGMARMELDRAAQAKRNLENSIELLPTAVGHLYLGNAERALGNRTRAIEQYRIAAQSDSAVGQRARQALQEMGAAQQ